MRSNDFAAQRLIGAAPVCLAVIFMLAVLATPVWPQANSATFYATVIDSSGAVVPGAHVALTDENTQATLNKVASATGDVAFTFVPVGTYTLKVDAPGFKSLVTRGIVLTAG